MNGSSAAELLIAEPTRRLTLWRRALDGPAVLGLLIIVGVALVAILAPLLAPADPIAQDLRHRLLPPAFLPGGSIDHLLGTDTLGRDLLSRILFGSRVTLAIGLLGVLIGGLVGVTAGLLAGTLGGRADLVLGRLADIQQAIPFVILSLAVVAVVGASLPNLIAVLGIGSWVYSFRVVRAESLVVGGQPFVEASRALGAAPLHLARHHILPNVAPSIIVVMTLFVPQLIVYAAGLSFLGLGVPAPTPEWGAMIAEGTVSLRNAPWLAGVPAVFLIVTVLGITLVGDWLRDALDPQRRRRT